MKVTVVNPQFAHQNLWQFEQPQYFEYQGEETQLKHVGSDQLCLTTGNPEWPVRVIARRLIKAIDGVAVKATEAVIQTKTVKGSKGELYTVTLGARPSCTCTGFQFRKTCKHIL